MAEKKLFKFTKPNSSVKLGYAQSKESFLVEIKKFYPTATLADINHAKELEKKVNPPPPKGQGLLLNSNYDG